MKLGKFFILFILVSGLVSCSSSFNSNELAFEITTMSNAQKQAELHDKKIIVDVYTVWCTWCKKLENEIYPDPRIGAIVNEYFYVVRIDAESQEEIVYNGRKIKMADFAQLLGVSTYPSTVFIDRNGTTIGQQSGFMEVEVFEKLLAFVGSSAYRTMQFDEFSVNSLPLKSRSSTSRNQNTVGN